VTTLPDDSAPAGVTPGTGPPPLAARCAGAAGAPAMETVRLLGQMLRHLSSGETAPGRVVEEIVRVASEHLGFERTALFAVDRDGVVRGLTGYGVSAEQIRAVAEAISALPLLEEALRRGRTVHSEDVAADGAIPAHLIDAFEVVSLVVAPLYAEQGLVGILCADRGAGRRFALSEDERVIVDAFASQVALALRIAQLVAEDADAARQSERLRIAERLHDTVAQLFYVIGAECARARAAGAAELPRAVTRIERMAARGGREVRRAIHSMGSLRPAEVTPQRLAELLASLRRLHGCEVTTVGDWQRVALGPSLWEVVLAAVSEGVVNAVKHGAARHVVLWLQSSPDRLLLEVRDDGDSGRAAAGGPAPRGGGFGLDALRRRLREVDGSLSLAENDDGGHTLRVSLRVSPA
jgi:signal transduction histidine kinase